jgi:hypothetical protein
VNESTGEATKHIVSPKYDDNGIVGIAQNWRSIGLKRIMDVKILGKKNKYTREEIIEMMYPSDNLSDDEKTIKSDLLSKGNETKNEDAGNDKEGEENDKDERELLFEIAEEMHEKGEIDKMPSKKISTKNLKNLVDGKK